MLSSMVRLDLTTSPRLVQQVRRLSQAALNRLTPISSDQLIWKTDESNPLKHNASHESLFYMLPKEKEIQKIFGQASPFEPSITRFYKVIDTMPLMIRRPSLEAKEYIERIQADTPNVKILLYGDLGRGKTHSLAHLVHYMHKREDHIIIQIHELWRFCVEPWEFNESTSRPGRFDTPINAALFLQQFRVQNAKLIELHRDTLKCKKDYNWSAREVTKAGDSIFNIADHGVNRVIHASDCVAVLFKELAEHADEGRIKLCTVIDNVEDMFKRYCGSLLTPDLKHVLVDEMTVARAIKKLVKSTRKNSLLLATCHDRHSKKQNQTPQEAIGREGWEHFDPFLPIAVPKYSRKEFEFCMNFYQDVGWLVRPVSRTLEARDEIRFVSGLNPAEVHRLCQPI